MKKIFYTLSAIIFSLPLFASAHVKWLIDTTNIKHVENYHWTDKPVLIWLVVVLLIIIIGIFLERFLPSPRKFSHPFFDYIDPIVISFFSIMAGIGFVIFSISGYLFAPPLIPSTLFGYILIAGQAIIGFGLILGVFVQVLSIALIVIYVLSAFYFGFENMLETLEIPGIAFMLLFIVRAHWTLFSSNRLETLAKHFRSYAVPLLRVFAGLNLIVLGFSEKILHPEFGLAFLAEYHWNFMQMAGFQNFTDYWFVLSAGVVQVLLGLVLILGIVTRINAFVHLSIQS